MGDTLNATFSFIRQNVVPLGKSLLVIAAPVYAVGAFAGVWIQQYVMQMDIGNPASMNATVGSGAFAWFYLTSLLTSVIGTALFLAAALGYLRRYEIRGPGAVPVRDVWQEVRAHFWSMLGTLLVVGLVFVGGMLIILVPCLGALVYIVGGLYLVVVLVPIFPVQAWEDVDLFTAFVRSRNLVQGSWWPTFGLLLVAIITYSLMTFLFVMPTSVIGFLASFHGFELVSIELSTTGRVLLAVFSFVGQVIASLLYAVPILATGFHYLSLVEQNEHVGLRQRVQARRAELEAEEADDWTAGGASWAL